MKRLLFSMFFMAFLGLGAVMAHAESALLGDLKVNGADVLPMADDALAKERGTSFTLLTNGPLPSQSFGIREHQVSYFGWGSVYDYRYYNYVGSGTTPGAQLVQYQGSYYPVAGDVWLADMTSPYGQWNRNNAQQVEIHFQIVRADAQGNVTEVSPFGLHATAGWNRPMTTFSW